MPRRLLRHLNQLPGSSPTALAVLLHTLFATSLTRYWRLFDDPTKQHVQGICGSFRKGQTVQDGRSRIWDRAEEEARAKKDTRPKHKTSVSFLEEDWLLIRETAYQKRMTVTEALTVAAREYAERENITLPDSETK